MGRKVAGLARIEEAIVAHEPIAATLRLCILLGGQSGSTELREWASRELSGYHGVDDLPAYRKVVAPLVIDGVQGMTLITGQQISPSALPDFTHGLISNEVPMAQGIGEIESLIESESDDDSSMVRLMPPGADDLVRYMNSERDEFSQITRLYWSVSKVALEGIVDRVRTQLTELVAEMRAGTPAGADMPTAAIADQALNVVVKGLGQRVTVVHGDGSMIDASQHAEDPGPFLKTRRFWGFAAGVATFIGTGLAIGIWQGWV